jgi:RHS repeat-associated protein
LVNPFQYTARESDTETGLYYYRARYYDPSAGRFLGEDPLGFISAINFYDYVGNSAVGFGDPMGLTQYPNNFVGPLPPDGYYTRDMTVTPCGLVPPHPPSANIDDNMAEAQKHWDPFWFRNQVKDKGPWDYKRSNPKYDDFGNFNYGATGIAFGFSGTRLQREAGRAQDPSAKGQGDPGWLLNPWGGTFPYGDDLPGQFQVIDGIEYAKCKQRKKCGS